MELFGLVIVICVFSKSSCLNFKEKDYVSWRSIDYNAVSLVIKDVILGLPSRPVAFGLDKNVDKSFQSNLTKVLHLAGIKTSAYTLSNDQTIVQMNADIQLWLSRYESANFLFFARHALMEKILLEIKENNLIHRNIVYIFLWIKKNITPSFRLTLQETLKVIAITNPRTDLWNNLLHFVRLKLQAKKCQLIKMYVMRGQKILYTQATSRGRLSLVNWWTPKDGMFRYPLLPSPSKVYSSFHGRTFIIPVLHKPPWFFVRYHNDTNIEVEGGRDDKLLSIIANKLKFRYEYVDPPDRSQGSSITNGSMQGALSLVATREADLFIGDLTVTYERSQAVEFSFLTLVDSELFLTHKPGLLNEALALIRPFHWIVWPAVMITLVVSAPVLYLLVKTSDYQKKMCRTYRNVFGDCVWITCTIFLQQAARFRSNNQKVRIIIVLLSLSLTYVIGDMYSASLTSLFARPSRERPISTLEELAEAMKNEQYQLLVEENSASHANLENGTGIYEMLWILMRKQERYFLESVEDGMKLVRDKKKYAIIGGRETFYYDTHRFGAENFHLSQKLRTRYSAIALQIGCPYLDNFNTVLMRLFEAGIYSKITEEEYQKLRNEQADGLVEKAMVSEGTDKSEPNYNNLKAMNMETLQGAFYILVIGYIVSVVAFLGEIYYASRQEHKRQLLIGKWRFLPKIANWMFQVANTSGKHVRFEK